MGESDLRKLFLAQFNREPSDEEMRMLQEQRITPGLFREWLRKQLDEDLTCAQVAQFVRNYKAKNGSIWNCFDIWVRESSDADPYLADKLAKLFKVIKSGQQDIKSTVTSITHPPTVLGMQLSGNHQGAKSRPTEEGAERRITRDSTLKNFNDLKNK